MFLLLSGEGSSDMGGITPYGAHPGPMAHIVDQLVYLRFDFSPVNCGLVHWISRSELSEICKTQQLKPHMLLPGARRDAGYAGYVKHAAALAWKARELERRESDQCVAVMFRDSDGTQSSSHDNWRRVMDAVKHGFSAMEFRTGVPMIPKPKQEAWFLCAKKSDAYMHCHLLEEESGNDNCPSPLKDQLVEAYGREPSSEDMCDWVVSREFDVERIVMPSFDAFKENMAIILDLVEGE